MQVSKEQIQILNDHIRENPDQKPHDVANYIARITDCLLYTSPSPRD